MPKKPDLNKPAFVLFPEAKEQIRIGFCPTCGEKIGPFKDRLSEVEFSISGMCQECQDLTFSPVEKEE